MKDDYSYWSENLHSSYLFYTMEVDKLNKENKRLREALETSKKMFVEQGHCPWADGTGEFNCEKCNDDCMFPILQQALGGTCD